MDGQDHEENAPRPKPNRKRQPVEVRARIIDAAISAFTQDGYEGARMRSIATDAGVSIQLLVHHVKTKELLWHAVMEHLLAKSEGFADNAKALPANTPASVRLRQQIVDLVHFTAATPELHRIMTHEAGKLTPRMIWLTETFVREGFQAWCALIEEAQREGAVRDVSPARLRYAIIAMGSVPFAVAAEYEFLTGKSPFSRAEVEHTIALICDMVFITSSSTPTRKNGR